MRRLGVVCAVFALAASSHAEPIGAIDSRSAHPPGASEETREHTHGPRHSGYFGDAEDLYHYELLLESPQRLVLYVNDELNHPLDTRTLQARYLLNPDGPAPVVGQFVPSHDGQYLLASLPSGASDSLHVKIEVLKDGQWVGLEFVLPMTSATP